MRISLFNTVTIDITIQNLHRNKGWYSDGLRLLKVKKYKKGIKYLFKSIEKDYGYCEASATERICFARILGQSSSTQEFSFYIKWIKKLARRGHKEAQYEFANIIRFFFNWYPKKFRLWRTKTWYLRAAKQGYSKAQNSLAVLLDEEYGNTHKAIIWWKKAARLREMCAAYNLVLYNSVDISSSPQKIELCYQRLQLSAEQGHLKARLLLEQNRYIFLDLQVLEEFARAGDREAQYCLGMRLKAAHDYSSERLTYVKSHVWLVRAANLGHPAYEDIFCDFSSTISKKDKDYKDIMFWRGMYLQESKNPEGIGESIFDALRWSLEYFACAKDAGHKCANGKLKEVVAELKSAAKVGHCDAKNALKSFFRHRNYLKMEKQILNTLELSRKQLNSNNLIDAEKHILLAVWYVEKLTKIGMGSGIELKHRILEDMKSLLCKQRRDNEIPTWHRRLYYY